MAIHYRLSPTARVVCGTVSRHGYYLTSSPILEQVSCQRCLILLGARSRFAKPAGRVEIATQGAKKDRTPKFHGDNNMVLAL